MKRSRHRSHFSRNRVLHRSAVGLGVIVLVIPAGLLLTTNAGAAATAAPLQTSATFSVLAGSGITDTGPTTISGDLGTYPTTTVTGTSLLTINGTDQVKGRHRRSLRISGVRR